jgi:hypothetical protein
MVTSGLVKRTAAFVEQQLKSNDASHDWRHIERVWTVARTLAKEEVGAVAMNPGAYVSLTEVLLAACT